MHDCLRDLLVQLALSEICWEKVARRKLRRINYQRLMETFPSVHRQSFILRVQTSSMRWLFGVLFLARVASLTFSQKRQNAPAIHLHACCVKPFYSDGNASMRVAAFRVIKTIHLHAATRWIFLSFSFFFCYSDFSSRRILLGSAVTVARSSWLQWQCSTVATRPPTVVKRCIVCLVASWRKRENIISFMHVFHRKQYKSIIFEDGNIKKSLYMKDKFFQHIILQWRVNYINDIGYSWFCLL